jgi:hypothetical protein
MLMSDENMRGILILSCAIFEEKYDLKLALLFWCLNYV